MKLNSLRLKNFIGVKNGLGLDEIELDLSGLSGLVALSGENGAGKSTILENLQPYRTLASRKGSLANHAYGRNAEKVLDFDFNEDNYRTKILIDADGGKQEGYIWQNGASLVDGKAREYDNRITELFGSKDLFFNSIFCAQNAQKLSDLTTGKLKELFSEFLQLHKYIEYENTVKQLLGAVTAQAGAYERQIYDINTRLETEFAGLEDEKAGLESSAADGQKRLEKIDREIEEVTDDIICVKERIAASAAMEARVNDFNERIREMAAALETAKLEYKEIVSGIRDELRTAKAASSRYSAIIENQTEIENAVAQKAELEKEIDAKSAELERGQEKLDEIRNRIYQHGQKIQPSLEPHKREADIPVLRQKIEYAQKQTAALSQRDPECTSTICSFIVGALEAEKDLERFEAELQKAATEVAVHQVQVEAIRKQAAEEKALMQTEEKDLATQVSALKTCIAELKALVCDCSKTADKHSDLQVALSRKESLDKRVKDLTKQGLKEKRAFDAKTAHINAQIEKTTSEMEAIRARIDANAKNRLTELEIVHGSKSKERGFIREEINSAKFAIQQIEKDMAQRDMLEKERAELSTKLSEIQQQISEWNYLKNAVSKDGLRALEIDSVAPSISAYANQILSETFGPDYAVKLRTQDDNGKEVLDIFAIGGDGRETLLENLSGGEKTWSLKALRLAMTLISKEKSGRLFETALSDEEDGALDAGNAQNFIQMYRAFMRAGGFDSCFFISHRPEAVALADSVLTFDKGGISIN